ncbi:MAG: TlpA family protein disulfide reductase [Planctomycetota bacterium]|nr:MAG: TlpA family protein disulfide reductase [Planctomycetota bacterium]
MQTWLVVNLLPCVGPPAARARSTLSAANLVRRVAVAVMLLIFAACAPQPAVSPQSNSSSGSEPMPADGPRSQTGGRDTGEPAGRPDDNRSDPLPSASSPQQSAAELDVQIVDFAQLQDKLQSFRGRVIVLDVWSTSCAPCLQEFPGLVELARKYGDQVQCVSLNLDYIGLPKKPPESYLPAIRDFLQSVDAEGIVHLVSAEPDDVMRGHLGIAAIPAIFIYDRDGRLVHKLTDANAAGQGVSYAADVLPKLAVLLSLSNGQDSGK